MVFIKNVATLQGESHAYLLCQMLVFPEPVPTTLQSVTRGNNRSYSQHPSAICHQTLFGFKSDDGSWRQEDLNGYFDALLASLKRLWLLDLEFHAYSFVNLRSHLRPAVVTIFFY